MSEVTTRSINGIELPPAGAYGFDQAHTTVGFVARHMLSKVHGRFTAYDGQVKIGEAVEDSSVHVEIKVDSITTDNEGRDEHLRSADFFEIETLPDAVVHVDRVPAGAGQRRSSSTATSR